MENTVPLSRYQAAIEMNKLLEKQVATIKEAFNEMLRRFINQILPKANITVNNIPQDASGYIDYFVLDAIGQTIISQIKPGAKPVCLNFEGRYADPLYPAFPAFVQIDEAAAMIFLALGSPPEGIKFKDPSEFRPMKIATDTRYRIVMMLAMSGFDIIQIAQYYGISVRDIAIMVSSAKKQFLNDPQVYGQVIGILKSIDQMIASYYSTASH